MSIWEFLFCFGGDLQSINWVLLIHLTYCLLSGASLKGVAMAKVSLTFPALACLSILSPLITNPPFPIAIHYVHPIFYYWWSPFDIPYLNPVLIYCIHNVILTACPNQLRGTLLRHLTFPWFNPVAVTPIPNLEHHTSTIYLFCDVHLLLLFPFQSSSTNLSLPPSLFTITPLPSLPHHHILQDSNPEIQIFNYMSALPYLPCGVLIFYAVIKQNCWATLEHFRLGALTFNFGDFG